MSTARKRKPSRQLAPIFKNGQEVLAFMQWLESNKDWFKYLVDLTTTKDKKKRYNLREQGPPIYWPGPESSEQNRAREGGKRAA